jgi:hypothetical protein
MLRRVLLAIGWCAVGLVILRIAYFQHYVPLKLGLALVGAGDLVVALRAAWRTRLALDGLSVGWLLVTGIVALGLSILDHESAIIALGLAIALAVLTFAIHLRDEPDRGAD